LISSKKVFGAQLRHGYIIFKIIELKMTALNPDVTKAKIYSCYLDKKLFFPELSGRKMYGKFYIPQASTKCILSKYMSEILLI